MQPNLLDQTSSRISFDLSIFSNWISKSKLRFESFFVSEWQSIVLFSFSETEFNPLNSFYGHSTVSGWLIPHKAFSNTLLKNTEELENTQSSEYPMSEFPQCPILFCRLSAPFFGRKKIIPRCRYCDVIAIWTARRNVHPKLSKLARKKDDCARERQDRSQNTILSNKFRTFRKWLRNANV